jgi:hypothetical protein
MRAHFPKIVIVALAAVFALGALDAASARPKKKHHAKPRATSSERWLRAAEPGHLVPVDRSGTPIIMQGYRSPAMMRDGGVEPERTEPKRQARRPVKIPRGSSTYIPPPVPSPYSVNSPPAPQPTVQPYNPPPITTFSDRVNSAIQAYPLERGIGNNPTDQQQFIRQRLNH